MPVPTNVKVEIEFVSGTWTDVTADFDYTAGYTIGVGRTSPQSSAQVSTVTVPLWNTLGKYTPGVQVLTDGSANPYYPNVKQRKRLRISVNSVVDFLGFVKSWQPLADNGVLKRVLVTASDVMDRLGRVQMKAPIRQCVERSSNVYAYWPCTDPSTATSAADASGETGPLSPVGAGAAPVFGGIGPGVGDGTGVAFAPTGSAAGQFLAGSSWFAVGSDFAIVLYVNIGTTLPSWGTMHIAEFIEPGDTVAARAKFSITSSGFAQFQIRTLAGTIRTGTVSLADGGWHNIILLHTSGTGDSLYCDDVQIGTTITPGNGANDVTALRAVVGEWAFDPSARFQGSMGQVAAVTFAPGSGTGIQQYSDARSGFDGELLSTRVTRFLNYAGVGGAGASVDTSTVTCGTYPQDGKDVLSALQDMAVTEGGGSVFYVNAGIATFKNRAYRKPAAPTLTVDASTGGDLDRSVWQPSLDDSTLLNQVSVQRATSSGTQSTQTVDNAAGQTADGLTSTSVTTYTSSDADALALAQSLLAERVTPGFRLPRVAVNLLTAKNNLYSQVAATGIGDRLRLTNIPSAMAPAGTLDLIVEGWTKTVGIGTYQVVYDTSPADNPRRGVWGDGTTITDVSYGRWQASTDCALNASITNSATTVVIKNPTGPTFTTNSAMYPMNIQVGAEIITLNSAPGGSTSPQTFTGVTRGAKGTTAAAQAANASVTLWPITTWTL